MDRQVPKPPSRGWLFAQELLGKPFPRSGDLARNGQSARQKLERLAQFSTSHAKQLSRLQAVEAEARRDRENLEWAAQISAEAAAELRALRQQEAENSEEVPKAQLALQSLLEGEWDPRKHPRAPKGRPDGGQWVAKGTGGGSGEVASTPREAPKQLVNWSGAELRIAKSSGSHRNISAIPTIPNLSSAHTTARTPAEYATFHRTSNGIPVKLAAARSQGGHHWVPWKSFGGFKSRMTEEAFKIFESGTKSPVLYDHGFDTWDSVTHGEYSNSLRDILDDWIKTCGGKLDKNDAAKFLSWIATGKCGEDAFAGKHKEAFAKVFKWRKGFLQSIVVAHAAAELNPKLTPAELKTIAQQVVNGRPTRPLSRAAAKTAKSVISGGKPLLRAVAKNILPGLAFFSAAAAARRGWAGQGHVGDGAWGAFNEAMRDLMIADVVEPIAFPAALHTVDGITDLIAPGLGAPSGGRYIRRGGKRIDLETGRVFD